MAQPAVDITPLNGKGGFLWSKPNINVDEFENDHSFKKIKVKGMFNHEQEIRVEQKKNFEKGSYIITPFYTHLNEKGEECGILVNRGWVPKDLVDLKLHYTGTTSGTITGLLYRGDAKTKYSRPNTPTLDLYHTITPLDFALIDRLGNIDEAAKFMLMQIDENPNIRQIHPSVPTAEEMVQWKITPERH